VTWDGAPATSDLANATVGAGGAKGAGGAGGSGGQIPDPAPNGQKGADGAVPVPAKYVKR
jgi:hypothetical protein